MADKNEKLSAPFSLPLSAAVTVFLLTFIVWIFFYAMQMPLNAQSITLVAVVMLALVVVTRWLWARTHIKKDNK